MCENGLCMRTQRDIFVIFEIYSRIQCFIIVFQMFIVASGFSNDPLIHKELSQILSYSLLSALLSHLHFK